MLGYLQSYQLASERLLMGPAEGEVSIVGSQESRHLPCIGFYSNMGDEMVLFYRWEGRLRLRFGARPSIDAQGGIINWERRGEKQVEFGMTPLDGEPIQRCYEADPNVFDMSNDPTEFAEAEDFDFFLFMHNVLKDQDRMTNLFRNAYSPTDT